MFQILPNWHPIFVHFTVALLSVALLVFVFSFFVKSAQLKQHAQIVARWNFWIAVVITFATVIAGWFAYNSVNHDTPSHLAMTEHKNWALLTTAILLVVAILAWWLNHHEKMFALGLIVVATFISITAWHGGELVYRYGLGVMSMPMMEGEGHDHGDHEHGGNNAETMQQHHDSLAPSTPDSHHAPATSTEEQTTTNNVHLHSDGSTHEH